MQVASFRAAKPGGPYERSVAELTRRWPRARDDIDLALEQLKVDRQAVPSPPNVCMVPHVGRTVLKVRVPSSDMGRGRSGGFRVLIALNVGDEWVRVLAYAKADRSDVPRDSILDAVRRETEKT